MKVSSLVPPNNLEILHFLRAIKPVRYLFSGYQQICAAACLACCAQLDMRRIFMTSVGIEV